MAVMHRTADARSRWKRASCSPVDGRARICEKVKRRYFIVSLRVVRARQNLAASTARARSSPDRFGGKSPNLRLIASSRAGVRTQPRTLARALALARAHRKNTHFLFFLHGFCLPPVARRLCRLSLEIPARRGREPCRGWVSRLVHRTTSRARESHSRDATRRRDEKTRARSTSRVPRRSSPLALALHAPIPSVLQRRIDARRRRAGSRAGARDVYVSYYRTNGSYYKVYHTSIFICDKRPRVGRRRARRGRGRQRPAGVARRRARDGDSR